MIKQYFIIDYSLIKGKELFPFHLYIYNPTLDIYNKFVTANSPMDRAKFLFLVYLLQQGAELAIGMSQKVTFLQYLSISESDIAGLTQSNLAPLEQARLYRIDEYKDELDIPYSYSLELKKAFINNNFSTIILRTKKEVSLFPLNISNTVSIASDLAIKLLNTDNTSNRIIATSYFISKIIGETKQEQLAELIVAAMIYHLGEAHIPLTLLRASALDIEQHQYKEYEDHIKYTLSIIEKLNIDLSPNCIELLKQHHERYSGQGYPNKLQNIYINPLALILAGSSHIFDYLEGKITSKTIKPYEVIELIHSAHKKDGLLVDFGGDFLGAIRQVVTAKEQVIKSAA